tara:strand:+ start:477 stop:623 length:147 start_codon:yes stop_codon:yes gene_type:complete
VYSEKHFLILADTRTPPGDFFDKANDFRRSRQNQEEWIIDLFLAESPF